MATGTRTGAGEHAGLARMLQERRDEILSRWRSRVRLRTAAGKLYEPVLTDHMGEILERLAELIEGLARGEPTAAAAEAIEYHAVSRISEDIPPEHVQREFGVLRDLLADMAAEDLSPPVRGVELQALERAIGSILDSSMASYELARRRNLEAVGKLATLALASRDFEDMLQRLLDLIVETESADAASILIAEEGVLRVRASAGPGAHLGACVPIGEGFAGQVAAERRPRLLKALEMREIKSEVLRAQGLRALYGVPLVISGGQLVGVAHIGTLHRDDFREVDKWLFRVIADRAAAAVGAHAFRERAERRAQALLASERRLRAILEASAEGIHGLDAEGRCTFVNAAGARLFGYRRDEMVGRSIHELVHYRREDGSPYPESACAIRASAMRGEPMHLPDETFWRRDGTSFRAEIWCYPSQTEQGGAEAVMTVFDVSERARRQKELGDACLRAESEARRAEKLRQLSAALSAALTPADVARTLFDSGLVPAGVDNGVVAWAVDSSHLEIVYAHARSREMLREYEALVGRGVPLPSREVLRTGRPLFLETPREIDGAFPHLEEFRRHLGDQSWGVLPMNSGGRVQGVLSIAFAEAHPFERRDRSYFEDAAELAAQALERASLYQQTRALGERAERTAALLEVLFQNSPAGIGFFDRQGRYQRVNRALAECHGIGIEEHLGRTPAELLGGDLGARVSHAVRRVLDSGEPVTDVAVSRDPLPGEERRHWIASFFPVRGAPGETMGVGAIIIDVTASRQVEAERERLVDELRRALRDRDESVAQLDAFIAAAPVGFALYDGELRYRKVNEALARINGVPAQAHLGKRTEEVLPGLGERSELAETMRRVLEGRETVLDKEIAGETPAAPGKLRHFLVSLFPVRGSDGLSGEGLVVREVTAEREAESFQRNIVGIVGHDLRSPLAAIAGSAHLLLRAPLAPEQRRVAERLRASADRMSRIIQALLDYSLARAGRGVPVEPRPAELDAICRAVIEEAEASSPGRRIGYEHDGDGRGVWDADRIAQVLDNLLGNALRYSPAEAPVAVRWRTGPSGAVIEVENRGPPIPESVLPHLFEPFRRGAEGSGSARRGLGLGLFISREIVQAHRGAIEAQTPPGGGALFRVHLPLRPATAATAIAAEPPEAPGA